MMMDFSTLYDPLYCQEVPFEEEEAENDTEEHRVEEDEEWAEALSSLLANEVETYPEYSTEADGVYPNVARRSAVEWIVKTSGLHGFSVQTVILAVNYLDRCFLAASGRGLRLQDDKPWMGRLAAVACLSLAAKVEETRVPILLDLQMPHPAAGEVTEYLFENKIIARMELLVLSTLGWRMNPVTPFSLARLLLAKIPATAGLWQELSGRCETALLSVLADWRWVQYSPSVWAAAVLHAVAGPADSTGASFVIQLLDLLPNVSKEKVGGAYGLILELSAAGDGFGYNLGIKRKIPNYFRECGSLCCYSSSESPNNPLSSCFTLDSSSKSVDSSTAMRPSSSSFPEPRPFKKPKQARDNGESKDLLVDHGVLLA